MSRVTIKTIAKELGVSHMTVSRALSGNPNVLSKTRVAVQKRALELGYVKSAAAMAMRGEAPNIVGLLLPNIVNEFYARFANEMALACDAVSLQLIVHITNDDIATEGQALARLREVQASAVVLVPAPGQPDSKSTDPMTMRVIELIRQRDITRLSPAILVEDASAIRDAIFHLVKAGHTQIAFIGADHALSSGRTRLDAFRSGATDAGLANPEALIRTGAASFQMGRENAREILDGGQATALVCGGFEISNGALSAIMDKRTTSGPEVAFIGYGDPSFYAWINGGISTIQVPVLQLADFAIELITKPNLDKELSQVYFRADLLVR